MKKVFLTVLLFSFAFSIYSQNQTFSNVAIGGSILPGVKLNVNGVSRVNNLQINKGTIKITKPVTTNTWSRGMMFYDDFSASNIELGGVGFFGTGSVIDRLSLGFGDNPWNSSSALHILSNGNVGIGSFTPDSKLTVTGNVNIGGDANGNLRVRHINGKESNSAGFSSLYLNATTGKSVIVGSTATSANMLVNGKVGIGTSAISSYELAVNGEIRAKEIKVETGWADFVFYKDYNLPTLKEVEQHIKEKGHLKDIPSAKEVEKNGIFLGQMDSKLLQKIEELTLYTIAQEKKIKEQKFKLEKEKKRNDNLEKRLEKIEQLLLKKEK